ncbi:MAG: sensor histidine kinase [Candidatus Sulfotelmatobacter sp.]
MTNPALTRVLAIFSPLPRQRGIERFTVALATAVLAVLLRGVLDPVLGHVAFYVTLYMAVAFNAVVCGAAPAALSSLVGFLGIFYWFVDPRHSLFVVRPSEIHGVVGSVLVCLVLITLGATNRRKRLELDQTVLALTIEGAQRQRVQQELRQAHDGLEQRVEERTIALSQALRRLESEAEMRTQREEQLRHLSVRLMTMQDEERRRIARELHDSAGQTLAAIKMAVASLESSDPRNVLLLRQLDSVNALVDDALREIRTTSYLLHPPLLDEVGIASAARWFVEGFAQRSGIQVTCEIAQGIERPTRDCELVLFRVLQESLTNVHRHAGASIASVRLWLDTDHLNLEVADNGSGISKERLTHLSRTGGSAGVGIAGMRARVRELGGYVEIASDNTGTIVMAKVPMAHLVLSNAYEVSSVLSDASSGEIGAD